METLNPYLNFDGNTKEVMEFYHSVLGGKLSIQTMGETKMAKKKEEEKRINHARLESDGIMIMASDTPLGKPPVFGNNIHLSLMGADEKKLIQEFDNLSKGGKVHMPLQKQFWGDTFGMFRDKFGVEWMINISKVHESNEKEVLEHKTLGQMFLKELESEERSTRKCLERIPIDKLHDWKPHEKSMQMGYLALVIAEIPIWITTMIEKGEIDFGTFSHTQLKTTGDLLKQFDENMKEAKKSLSNVSNEELEKPFELKNKGQILFSSPKKDNICGSINHLVHHRGQLTVYMRLNNIPVPQIYGPSADEKGF